MKFCEHCKNMLYVSVDEDSKLLFYCKSCNHKVIQDVQRDNSVLIIDDNKIDESTRYAHFLNKYLKFDPTLPRVNNISCTNESCTKQKDGENEVIYLKYDHANMQYLYYCCHCDHFWLKGDKPAE